MQSITLEKLAEHVGGKVVGHGSIAINAVSTLSKATAGEITFLANRKYESLLKTTNASAVIASSEVSSKASTLVVKDPYYAFMQIVVLLHGHRTHKRDGVNEKANIAESAKIGENCNIHNFATVAENAIVGDNCVIYPGAFIGPNATVGNDCIIYPNAVIYDETVIGDRVIIHANAVVGVDGFGFATHKGIHHKIPQIGKVILQDDVEIGAAASIERATLGNTTIGQGTKIGDLVVIGHGTSIGPYCLLVPQAGVAGSTKIGHHCVFGGQTAVAGHITIGDMVTFGARSGVSGDVGDGRVMLGTPAIDANLAKRSYALFSTLPDMRKQIKQLQRKLDKMEKSQLEASADNNQNKDE